MPDADEGDALRELVRALERFPSLFSLNHDAVALYAPDGEPVVGNDASRALIREEFSAFHSGRHIEGGELERAQTHFKTALRGEPVEFESVLVGRDGEAINVVARLVPALVDGKIVGVFGTARDITLQRRAEASRDESREQFRSLFEQHPDSISMVDAAGRYERLNAAAQRMTGYLSAELAGKKLGEVFPPAEREGLDEFVAGVLRSGKPTRYERSVPLGDGATRAFIEGTAVPIVVNESVTGVFLMSRDVTERNRIQESLALLTTRGRKLQRVFSETGADPDEQASSVLDFSLKELGFDSACVIAIDGGGGFAVEHCVGTTSPIELENSLFQQLLRETVAGSGLLEAGDAPAPFRSFAGLPLDVAGRRCGALVYAGYSVKSLTECDREFLRSVAELISANIERAMEKKRLQSLANYDSLTGLPNRLLLNDRFNTAIASAQRRGEQVAVYFIDVDKFKAINDTYGHLVGDEVLRTFARRLLKACRASDTVARLAGDEFIVLQSGLKRGSRSEALAARLCKELEAPCDIEGVHLNLSVGIGISVFPRDGQDQRTLLKNADTALYAAKSAGPGSIRQFGAVATATALLRPKLERSRHKVIESLSGSVRER